jgi:hypothetical protein
MARNVIIKLNPAGVRALLRDPAVRADLEARGRRIAAAAGSGHEVETQQGRTRTRVTVRTESFAAMEREARRRSLTRAIDAGR